MSVNVNVKKNELRKLESSSETEAELEDITKDICCGYIWNPNENEQNVYPKYL